MKKDILENYSFYDSGKLKTTGFFGAQEMSIEGITVKIEYTQCNMYGGKRAWFLCPTCSKRIMKLTVVPQENGIALGCRECLNLTYMSTRMDADRRLMFTKGRRVAKIAKKLNLNKFDIDKFRRWKIRKRMPRNMYKKTYKRLYAELKVLLFENPW